ncbi:ATP-binding cassette domain-containing protein [Fulvivirgaceae bacterium BMA10]|uniref:ATP-binding cassette domain-containing protein n=1 Tax=Splendidivirga corallicola TaxID=3051826 RepID=A0ABT8KSN8_9BACT|nr:ATP-binding cassette domain-containing protein [Fulvivirgaceae bacterium BMA10]
MAIVVENLSKNYDLQRAVDNISFEIKTGEVVGFLGPNGAGKSTTMKMITGYLAPTTGLIRLDDLSVEEDSEKVKRRIGYLPENNPLYTDMAIVDYLRFCAQIQGVKKTETTSKIASMIDRCGLDKEKHKKINELSKGYRQRVGLAQAMIHDPDVLILDEPTTGLDPNQIVEIRNLIKELGKEKTVILSSHILSEVEATCDRILIINKGRIVADGTAENLREQAKGNEIVSIQIAGKDGGVDSEMAKKLLTDLASVQTVKIIDKKENGFQIQSKPDASSKRAIFDLCVENNWYITEMTGDETKLEDVFRKLTN